MIRNAQKKFLDIKNNIIIMVQATMKPPDFLLMAFKDCLMTIKITIFIEFEPTQLILLWFD